MAAHRHDIGVDPVTVLALIGTCVSLTLINPYPMTQKTARAASVIAAGS